MLIAGIDPGTATTGFGFITPSANGFTALGFGVISTDKKLSDGERLETLHQDLKTLLSKNKPDVLGIEKLFFASNQKTIIPVAQARGVITLLAANLKIPILEFTPLQVKLSVCGFGKADKKQVQFMVMKSLRLPSIPKPDDAADALAIALCAANQRKLIGLGR